MAEKITMFVGIILSVLIIVLPFILADRCPDCSGKLVDDDYDENIGRVVWTCKSCGKKWILY